MVASTITVSLVVLVALAVVKSQDTPGLPSFPGLPNIPGLSNVPGFSSLPSFAKFPGIPNFSGIPNFRGERQAPASDSEDGASFHQGRFFFHSFPSSVSCNYTTESGRTCRSCNQALTCFSSNTGFILRCHSFFPYCNDGSCSFFPGSDCDSTTTATSSTSTTSTTTTTTAATGR